MANDQQNGGSNGLVLPPGAVVTVADPLANPVGSPPASPTPTATPQKQGDSSVDFRLREFSAKELKSLDIDAMTLPEMLALLQQLMDILNESNDGIYDNKQVRAVPLFGHQAKNLTSEAGIGSGEEPIKQDLLLFSVEVAYFIAQIANKLAMNDVFNENLSKNYIADDPEILLARWLEVSGPKFSIRQVENKKHWRKIIDVMLESAGAIQSKLTATPEEKSAEAAGADAEASDEKKAEGDDDDDFWSADDGGKDTAGGEGAGEPQVEQPPQANDPDKPPHIRHTTTAPEEVMRSFLQAGGGEVGLKSNKDFLRKLQGGGFSSEDRRLIVDQTAWIYNGVLAQLYPDAVGKFGTLDPSALAQVNQIVRDYMMEFADRPDILRSLIANPLARRDFIFDILQKNSPYLSVLAQRDQAQLINAIDNLNREQIIAEQLPELERYLLTNAEADGVKMTPEEAKLQAYNGLSALPSTTLRGLAAGQISIRKATYDAVARSSAEAILARKLDSFAGAAEKLSLENITLSLDSAVLKLFDSGESEADILDYFTDLPRPELLLLMGIDSSNPLYATYLTNIQEIRDAAQLYIRQRLITLHYTPAVQNKAAEKQSAQGRISRALAAPTFTPAQIAGRDGTEKIAEVIQPTTADKSKAYFKHYLERWNMLSVEAQAVIYLLSRSSPPKNYLSKTAPVEPLEPTPAFIDFEPYTHSPAFQKAVELFTKNPSDFQQIKNVEKLRAVYESGLATEQFVSTDTILQDQVRLAENFANKYKNSWVRLSKSEKTAVYLMAGVAVSGSDLPVINAYIGLADAVGTPEFNKIVELVDTYHDLNFPQAGSEQIAQYISSNNIDMKLSDQLTASGFEDAQATQYALQTMSREEQQAMAVQQGYESPEQLVQAQQAAATQLGGSVSPEQLAFIGSGSGEGGFAKGLAAFRKAQATNTPLPTKEVGRFSKEALKKTLAAMDKSIGLALAAVPGVGAGLAKVWNSKYGKPLFLAPLISYIKAMSTPFGFLGGTGGAIIGTFTPMGPLATSFIGAHIGAYGPWGGGAWPWEASPSATPLMESSFAVPSATATPMPVAAATGVAVATPVATATASATSGAATGMALVAPFVMPAYALLFGAFMTATVFFIIWGAFIAPAPTEPLPALPSAGETQASAQYITVTKTADPNAVDNPVGGATFDVEYTLTIAPKPGYRIEITGFTDEYTSFGDIPAEITPSEMSLEQIQAGIVDMNNASSSGQVAPPVTDPSLLLKELVVEYGKTGVTGKDAYLINTATIEFRVKDYLSETYVASNQKYVASAAVIIGEPKVGCFVLGNGGMTIGNDGGPIVTKDFSTSEMNTFINALAHPVMANPTYIQLLCAQGPVTIYRAVGSGRSWWGYGGVSRSIVFYDLIGQVDAFDSADYLLYNLIHESAHVIDSGGARMYRRQFSGILPANLYGCFTYPKGLNCNSGEAFAEATMLYVLNKTPFQSNQNYDFKSTYPEPYNWLKDTIFGGIEYTN